MHLARSVLACALLASAGVAHADKTSTTDKVEADKHYQLGKRHYNLNEWDEAIAEFKAAYKLFPDPVNLYNIAQAYRLKGKHCTAAAQFYANYQREEKNKRLRDSVTKVRKDMEACARTEKPDEPAPSLPMPPMPAPLDPSASPPPAGQPPPIATQPPPAPPMGDDAMRGIEPPDLDPNRNRRILGYVLMIGGGVSILGGIGFSFQVSSLEDKLSKCDDFGCPGGEDELALQDRRDRAALSANGAYGLGVSAVVVGGILYVISRKPKQDSRLTVLPARGGAVVRWAF